MNTKVLLFCGLLAFSPFTNETSGQQTQWVLNSGDSGPGSLRDAIANATAGDIIRFMPGVTIVQLTTAEILIDKPVTILGHSEKTLIKRNLSYSTPPFRIFNISIDEATEVKDTLFLVNLSIANGLGTDGTFDHPNGQDGGGILVSSPNLCLSLINCEFYNNISGNGYSHLNIKSGKTDTRDAGRGGHGGAVYSVGEVLAESCTFNNNSTGNGGDRRRYNFNAYAGAGGSGGALFVEGKLKISSCSFTGNKNGDGGYAYTYSYSNYLNANGGAGGAGGAIYAKGELNLINSELSFNNTGKGGRGEGGSNTQGRGDRGGSGGAVAFYTGAVHLENNTFNQNYTGNGGKGHDNGSGAGSGGSGGYGGALYINDAEVEVYGCVFSNNMTGNGNSGSGQGGGSGGNGGFGGAFALINCSLICLDSEFEANHTGNGANGGGGYGSFSGGGGAGGALYAEKSTGLIELGIFNENHSGDAGNAYGTSYGTYTRPGGGGGALSFHDNSDVSVTSCSFVNNRTGNGGKVTGNNNTSYSGGDGGNGGAISLTVKSTACLTNNLIANNVTGVGGINTVNGAYPGYNGKGGGICSAGGSLVKLINSTVAGNKTGITDSVYYYIPMAGHGGGLFTDDTSSALVNSILAFNEVWIIDSLIMNDIFGDIFLDHCLVHDTAGIMISGFGNIFNRDPVFMDFPVNLEPIPMSPVINNGNPDTSGLSLPSIDLNGNPRIFQRIDMGAFEYPFPLTDSLGITPDTLDFGDIFVGQSEYGALILHNYGTSTIQIDSLILQGFFYVLTGSGIWTQQADSTIVYPGESLDLPVKFHPEDPGDFVCDAIFWINAHTTPYYAVLKASATLPIPPVITANCPDKLFPGESFYCELFIETFNGLPLVLSNIEKPDFIQIQVISDNIIILSGATDTVNTGYYIIQFNAGDDVISAMFHHTFEIIQPLKPSIEHNCNTLILAGYDMICEVNGIGYNDLPVDINIYVYPEWITWEKMNNQTIGLSGTPLEEDAGDHELGFIVSDSISMDSITFSITVGINAIGNISDSAINIFFHNRTLIISNNQNDYDHIILYNLLGLPVFEYNIRDCSVNCSVSIPGIPTGVYIITLKNHNSFLSGKILYH